MVPASTLMNFIEEVVDLRWVDTSEVWKGIPPLVEDSVQKVILCCFVLDSPSLDFICRELPHTKESCDWVHLAGS